jgi:IS5 family transposase
VNVDEDGFIKTVGFTAANVHDSRVFENLLTGSENACYADKAYKSKKHDQLLNKKTIENCILNKAKRNKPLTQEQKQQNKNWSGTRSTVERTFGILKLHYGIAKARYLGLMCNQGRFMLTAIAKPKTGCYHFGDDGNLARGEPSI